MKLVRAGWVGGVHLNLSEPDLPSHCVAPPMVVWLRPLNPAFGRHLSFSFRPLTNSSSSFPLIMPSPLRWLLLDTDTRDLVAIHTDGNEQISVVSFSPGRPGVLGRQGLGD